MKIAVIKSGGKQYVVQEGSRLKVERLPIDAGKPITIKEILLNAVDGKTTIGTPLVAMASVQAQVVRHGQGKKITGVKMKAKKRQKHYFGHRQEYTEIEVSKIESAPLE